MHPTKRARLNAAMDGMAAGDNAYIWSLVADFGDELAKVVRRIVCGYGRHDVLADRLEALVIDSAILLFELAPAWQPDGAVPWVWARRAIEAHIAAEVGHRSVEFDAAAVGAAEPAVARAGPGTEPSYTNTQRDIAGAAGVSALDQLTTMGYYHPEVHRLIAALRQVASERHIEVHTEYRFQIASGDPSPSQTVGEMFGIKPDNVRQIDFRVRGKLRNLARNNPDFAELEDLRWLA